MLTTLYYELNIPSIECQYAPPRRIRLQLPADSVFDKTAHIAHKQWV